MCADIASTNYAISNGLGYEGNGFMSNIVTNPILFILTKLIGSMVIIFMMSKIIQKNENIAKVGMKIIIFMMLFVIGNNLMVISASALVFTNFSGDAVPGSVNDGNGYFDDDPGAYGYSGSRNVYAITESSQIWLFEPLIYASGGGTAYQLINSSYNSLNDSVVHNGYLYFIDGGYLKKKKSRDVSNICESNDTSISGCIMIIDTSVGTTLRVLDGQLYYTSQSTLKHLDVDDNSVTDFSVTGASGGETQIRGFTVYKNSSVVTIYYTSHSGGNAYSERCTSTGCTFVTNIGGANPASNTSAYTTSLYYYYYVYTASANTAEQLRYISNSTDAGVNYITTAYYSPNRIYVGSRSTIGLFADPTTYNTFNSNEAGVSNSVSANPDLTYDTATITSLESQYYNKSDIYLEYNVILDSLNVNNLLLDFDDYRWMVSMTDPNGVTQDIIQSPECTYTSVLDTTCQVTSTMGIHAPTNGWLQGTWSAKLYEINTITANRELIVTSTSFTVLNTSEENQSIVPPPFIPPTAGTAPQAISIIDGWVSWLGLGVNSVSKLLFAMILIAIAGTVGLIWGNGDIAMVFAFVPYAFFTYIDYIPKWMFIITIILMAIVSRAFR